MANPNQELEVKFHISNPRALRAKLEALGAQPIQPRTLETNLRFDAAGRRLRRARQVLRLRQDNRARLTFKGPSQDEGGARLRQEIEFDVSDFAAARAFLEALGFQVRLTYEKYREIYEWKGVFVALDELPYGDFAEIEGEDAGTIRAAAGRLGLDWQARIPGGYVALFERLRAALGLPFRDLTFENFAAIDPGLAALGCHVADKG